MKCTVLAYNTNWGRLAMYVDKDLDDIKDEVDIVLGCEGNRVHGMIRPFLGNSWSVLQGRLGSQGNSFVAVKKPFIRRRGWYRLGTAPHGERVEKRWAAIQNVGYQGKRRRFVAIHLTPKRMFWLNVKFYQFVIYAIHRNSRIPVIFGGDFNDNKFAAHLAAKMDMKLLCVPGDVICLIVPKDTKVVGRKVYPKKYGRDHIAIAATIEW